MIFCSKRIGVHCTRINTRLGGPRSRTAAVALHQIQSSGATPSRSRLSGLWTVLLLLSAGSASASGRAALTLDEALLAVQQAPEIRARRAGVDAATLAIGPAGELPDPALVFGIENLPVDGGEAFSLTDDFMSMRKVGVMQAFPTREKRRLRTDRAESEAARERALLAVEQLAVQEAVARAWIALASAQERVAMLESMRPLVQAQLTAATSAVTAGSGSVAEGIAARTAIEALEDRIDNALATLASARAELERWIPDLGDRVLAPAPDWRQAGPDPALALGDIAHHRELLAYAAMQRTAQTDVELARAEKWPDWSVELSYAQRGPQYSNMLSLQFNVGLPVFASRRQDPRIAAATALQTRIEAEREAAQRIHRAELDKTVVQWRSTARRIQRFEKELLPLSDDRAEVALAAYQGGSGKLKDALMAFEAAIEQRLAYIELKESLGQAWATLHFAFPQER